MLSEEGFIRWCQENNLQDKTKHLIQNVRSSPPSRRVKSGTTNVSGRFPSQKMQATIQFESHRCELPFIYQFEHDEEVLEFYDQPPPIKFSYTNKDGKKVGYNRTPDFFVIRRDGAGWEECKTEELLQKKTKQRPECYDYSNHEGWRSIPGESYAGDYDLYYDLRSDAEIDWVFQRNLRFLEDYFRNQYPVSDRRQKKILNVVQNEVAISLHELLNSSEVEQADEIYSLIASHDLYVDLTHENLTEPKKVTLFENQQTATAYIETQTSTHSFESREEVPLESGQSIVWNGKSWQVLNCGDEVISLLSETHEKTVELPIKNFQELLNNGSIKAETIDDCDRTPAEGVMKQLRSASSEAIEEANKRYELIQTLRNGQEPQSVDVSKRTIQRWNKKFKEAQSEWGNGFVGLLPKHHQKGTNQSKLPRQTRELLQETIEDRYENLKQKDKKETFGEFLLLCEEEGIPSCSYQTFVNYVNNRDQENQTRSRKGRRASYDEEDFYWALELKTPRHGERPFEIAHLDHTQLDVELVSSETEKNLGRPWVTFLTDAYSRRLLAIYLSFESPSVRSCMMTLRECVRRYNRLPNTLVVDQGKEFESVYFESLLARYSVTKKTRPAAKARYGSVCERLFDTANTQLIHNLVGNTKIMKNVREVTQSVNPKNLAKWTLEMLHEALGQWGYEHYDTREHPALGQSPRKAFQQNQATFGKRPQVMVPYNEEFRIMTLPAPSQGTRKVMTSRGVKFHYIYYWNDAFRDPEIEGSHVDIRFDPYDAGRIYAYVKDEWVECISELYPVFREKSKREVKLATEEIRREKTQLNANQSITAKKIAQFLRSQEESLKDQKEEQQRKESKKVRSRINPGQSSDSDQPFIEMNEPPNSDTTETQSSVESFGKY